MKQKTIKSICSIIWILVISWNFTRCFFIICFMSPWIFVEKYWWVWKFWRKMPGRFNLKDMLLPLFMSYLVGLEFKSLPVKSRFLFAELRYRYASQGSFPLPNLASNKCHSNIFKIVKVFKKNVSPFVFLDTLYKYFSFCEEIRNGIKTNYFRLFSMYQIYFTC